LSNFLVVASMTALAAAVGVGSSGGAGACLIFLAWRRALQVTLVNVLVLLWDYGVVLVSLCGGTGRVTLGTGTGSAGSTGASVTSGTLGSLANPDGAARVGSGLTVVAKMFASWVSAAWVLSVSGMSGRGRGGIFDHLDEINGGCLGEV
jgi:hypothetical protein